MTENEARVSLIVLHMEYMSHSKKERLKLYDKYIENRNLIKEALIKNIDKEKQKKIA